MSRRQLAAQGKLGCFQMHLCVYVFFFLLLHRGSAAYAIFPKEKSQLGRTAMIKRPCSRRTGGVKRSGFIYMYIYIERFFFRCCRWHSLCQYLELCDFTAAAFTTHRLLKKGEEEKKHSTSLSH